MRFFEANRSITGMAIEMYPTRRRRPTGARPPDVLAQRLFDLGATKVTVYSNVVTVEAPAVGLARARAEGHVHDRAPLRVLRRRRGLVVRSPRHGSPGFEGRVARLVAESQRGDEPRRDSRVFLLVGLCVVVVPVLVANGDVLGAPMVALPARGRPWSRWLASFLAADRGVRVPQGSCAADRVTALRCGGRAVSCGGGRAVSHARRARRARPASPRPQRPLRRT